MNDARTVSNAGGNILLQPSGMNLNAIAHDKVNDLCQEL
jgi:hypothetical protein